MNCQVKEPGASPGGSGGAHLVSTTKPQEALTRGTLRLRARRAAEAWRRGFFRSVMLPRKHSLSPMTSILALALLWDRWNGSKQFMSDSTSKEGLSITRRFFLKSFTTSAAVAATA